MEIGIIAGNKKLPILLAKRLAESNKFKKIVGICFKGETSPKFCSYVDRHLWVEATNLGALRQALQSQNVKNWVMAGQVNPLAIFKPQKWDLQLKELVKGKVDFCPHNIFKEIISYLEEGEVTFLESISYLDKDLAQAGQMNSFFLTDAVKKDIDFGLKKINKFVETDIGQTLVVKSKAVVAAESLEGTDNTIKRGFKLAGKEAVVLKFAKQDQDLRFDVPVVGLATLRLLKKIKASALVLEENKTIILEKEKFLDLSKKWKIPIIGAGKINNAN